MSWEAEVVVVEGAIHEAKGAAMSTKEAELQPAADEDRSSGSTFELNLNHPAIIPLAPDQTMGEQIPSIYICDKLCALYIYVYITYYIIYIFSHKSTSRPAIIP